MNLPLLSASPFPGLYARFLRRVAEGMRLDPGARVSVPLHLDGYFGHCKTVADVSREVRKALNRRINARGGEPRSRGRQDNPDSFMRLWRDSRIVLNYRTRRVVPHGSGFETTEARKRFPIIQAAMREPLYL